MTTNDPRDLTYAEALARAQPRLAELRVAVSAAIDQALAFWRDVEPSVRAWVAEADRLTEQQWMDQAESTRAFYDTMRACLTEIDQRDRARTSENGEEQTQP